MHDKIVLENLIVCGTKNISMHQLKNGVFYNIYVVCTM